MRTRTALMESCTLDAMDISDNDLYIRQAYFLRVSLNLCCRVSAAKIDMVGPGNSACAMAEYTFPVVIGWGNEW